MNENVSTRLMVLPQRREESGEDEYLQSELVDNFLDDMADDIETEGVCVCTRMCLSVTRTHTYTKHTSTFARTRARARTHTHRRIGTPAPRGVRGHPAAHHQGALHHRLERRRGRRDGGLLVRPPKRPQTGPAPQLDTSEFVRPFTRL